jgi:nicotinate-nucleotide adenylyltransferase
MRVALMGGSFNPPHVGHLLAAQYVHATQEVDEVWLLPSHQHPFGKQLAPWADRLEMCFRLCAEASGWLKVSEVERELGGQGYTVDTLEHLSKAHPGTRWTWIIGSDIVKDLPSWKDVPRIQQLAQLLVLQRAGHPEPRALGPPLAEVSSSDVRGRIRRGERPSELVPRTVLDWVEARGLYRAG